ncbi:hypothetical protein CCMA1212_003667 [Trichoderma ghanense]|uniref:Uncharacterized protein n=1 Tax=Trichoderma ghanense TaxID=65468 RepID=A0ABY2H701_9HYPO
MQDFFSFVSSATAPGSTESCQPTASFFPFQLQGVVQTFFVPMSLATVHNALQRLREETLKGCQPRPLLLTSKGLRINSRSAAIQATHAVHTTQLPASKQHELRLKGQVGIQSSPLAAASAAHGTWIDTQLFLFPSFRPNFCPTFLCPYLPYLLSRPT